jgi:hypothetical protein
VKKFKFFRLKNEMLFTNYAAIFLGACAAIYLTYRSVSPQPAEAVRLATRAAWIFEPSALFLFGAAWRWKSGRNPSRMKSI